MHDKYVQSHRKGKTVEEEKQYREKFEEKQYREKSKNGTWSRAGDTIDKGRVISIEETGISLKPVNKKDQTANPYHLDTIRIK